MKKLFNLNRKIYIAFGVIILAGLSFYLLQTKYYSDRLFANKVKCESYAKGLNQEFDQYNQEAPPPKDGDHYWAMKTLETIFYSPKLDTCLYSVHDFEFFPATQYPCSTEAAPSAFSNIIHTNTQFDEATKKCAEDRFNAERKLSINYHVIYDILTKNEVARFKYGANGQEKEYHKFLDEYGGKVN